MCKISILLPVHNSGLYLNECIDSIQQQTYQDFEILCIDDSSVDRTREIIFEYMENDKRIKYISENNSSYGFKINLGIRRAKGEYICILESDDYFAHDFLESCMMIHEAYKLDYVDTNYTEFKLIGNKRHFEEKMKYFVEDSYNHIVIADENIEDLRSGTSAIWTGLYRKEFLVKNNLFLNESEGAAYQDTSFRFLINCYARKSYHIKRNLHYYRCDNVNSSTKDVSKSLVIISEYKYLLNELKVRNIFRDRTKFYFYRWKYAGYIWNLGRLDQDSNKEFIELFKREVANDFITIEKMRKERKIDDLFSEVFRFYQNAESYVNNIYKERKNEERVAQAREKWIELAQKNKVVIWGSGNYGRRLLNILKEERESILCIGDNNNEKQNTLIEGFEVLGLETIQKKYRDNIFFIANKNDYMKIKEQMIRNGVDEKIIYIYREFE